MPPVPRPTSLMKAVAEEELLEEATPGRPVCLPEDLPKNFRTMSFLGVDYVHLKTADDGELFLTPFGVPYYRQLLPENWFAPDWFKANRERLEGTSTIYRLPTRPVDSHSLDLVVKWSRVGERIPVDTFTINQFVNAEFNSPFEEFSLLMELRKGRFGPSGVRIRTQHPLAIYVPPKRLQLWQTGRSEDKIRAKIAKHPGVEIDILRQYLVLFRWVKGLDAVQVAEEFKLQGQEMDHFLSHASGVVIHELAQKGYRVMDMKPAHIIMRPKPSRSLLRDRHGQFAYALIDYELLQRTPEHEAAVLGVARRQYLKQVARPFDWDDSHPLPPHLRATRLLGVDYLFGHAESTGGSLWVVGRNPFLFHHFLPERWRRTQRIALSESNQVYYTRTKDNINLVWRVSRMGEWPFPNDHHRWSERARHFGFNSAFEEVALALELDRLGIKTVHPRAIYRTSAVGADDPHPADYRRYETLGALRTPDNEPAISLGYEYITVWGYWKRRERSSVDEIRGSVWATNAARAVRRGLVSRGEVAELVEHVAGRLRSVGYEDLGLDVDHFLLSFDAHGRPIRDEDGLLEVRLCSFELMRRRSGSKVPSVEKGGSGAATTRSLA